MKKFWWGLALGILIGAVVLAPNSDFGLILRDIFVGLRDSVVALLAATGEGALGLADGVEGGGY